MSVSLEEGMSLQALRISIAQVHRAQPGLFPYAAPDIFRRTAAGLLDGVAPSTRTLIGNAYNEWQAKRGMAQTRFHDGDAEKQGEFKYSDGSQSSEKKSEDTETGQDSYGDGKGESKRKSQKKQDSKGSQGEDSEKGEGMKDDKQQEQSTKDKLIEALKEAVGDRELDAKELEETQAQLKELEARVEDLENRPETAAAPTKVEVYEGDKLKKEIEGAHHYLLPELLKLVALRIHTILIGPAGTGKSHVAHQAAEALDLPFYAISIGPQMTQASLMGYTSPTGALVRTSFREAFENGGIMCLDEVDAGSAAVLTCINSAMANGVCGFPDGMVKRHPDFVLVCTANTYGTGKTMEYVGRNPLDAAFLNRFARMTFPVDMKLEQQLGALPEWTSYIQTVRAALEKAGIKAVISPRQSIMGGKMIASGQFTPERARDLLIYPGMSDDAQSIVGKIALPKFSMAEAV